MSIAIDMTTVTGLLLRGQTEWFEVSIHNGISSLYYDAFELVADGENNDYIGLGFGEISSVGVSWVGADGFRYAAAISDVMAYRYRNEGL